MRFASYVLSLALHAILLLVMLFWPASPIVNLDRPPVLISLVEGAPGGNNAPSPILGPQGAPGEEKAPSMPAPQQETAAPEVPDAAPIAQPKVDAHKELEKPKPVAEPKEKPAEPREKPKEALPEPDAVAIAKKKAEEKKKKEEEKKKKDAEEKKKSELAKQEADRKKKEAAKKSTDPIKDALAQARAASSRENSPNKGSAVERALAEARRKAGGAGGGGGGQGDGPGGGGLHDVYIGQVMLAVRPNWGYANAARVNYVCYVHVNVDAKGKVLRAEVERPSGNTQFDASAVNAVIRTGAAGQFPPPPDPSYYDLVLAFTMNEMMGR